MTRFTERLPAKGAAILVFMDDGTDGKQVTVQSELHAEQLAQHWVFWRMAG